MIVKKNDYVLISQVLIALLLFRFCHQILKFMIESRFIDLAYHYVFSTMARNGYDLFDQDAIIKTVDMLKIRPAGGRAVYSPTYFILFQPLTLVPFRILTSIWILLSSFIVFYVFAIIWRYANHDKSWVTLAFLTALITLHQPLYEDLGIGQNNCLILLLCTVLYFEINNDRQWVSAFCLAAIAFIKIQFGLLFGIPLLLGNYRLFIFALLFFGLLFFLGLPQLGADHYINYFSALVEHTSKTSLDVNNSSLNGMINRLLSQTPILAKVIYVTTSSVLIGWMSLWCLRNRGKIESGWPYLMGILLVIITSPNTEPHHLVLILLPLIIVSLRIDLMNRRIGLIYGMSVLLTVSRYSWNRFIEIGYPLLSPLLSLKMLGVFCLLIVMKNEDVAVIRPREEGNKKLS